MCPTCVHGTCMAIRRQLVGVCPRLPRGGWEQTQLMGLTANAFTPVFRILKTKLQKSKQSKPRFLLNDLKAGAMTQISVR